MKPKPIVYVASPYTKGDPCLNTHFQLKLFNMLLNDDKVVPFMPLLSHFQNVAFPRPYMDWLNYDREIIRVCDACLRLDADLPEYDYFVDESSGADTEEVLFKQLRKPIFYLISDLYKWAEQWRVE